MQGFGANQETRYLSGTPPPLSGAKVSWLSWLVLLLQTRGVCVLWGDRRLRLLADRRPAGGPRLHPGSLPPQVPGRLCPHPVPLLRHPRGRAQGRHQQLVTTLAHFSHR